MDSPVKNWTEGRFRSFVTSTIRSGFRRYPPKFEVLKEAAIGKKENKKSKRIAMHYECSSCKEHFVNTDIQVDHILPVVDPKKGFINWDTFIERLFCTKENLQVLCKACHKDKTNLEKKERTNESNKPKQRRTRKSQS
jgi:5-methylcytosine-specific restriction endonuclease McrA